jgi:hypothetical protein
MKLLAAAGFRRRPAARAAIAGLLLCAVFGTARAEPLDELAASADAIVVIPSVDQEREEQADARALAERRQEMIDDCEQNHGSEIDCEREADTELRAEGLQWHRRIIIHPGSAR